MADAPTCPVCEEPIVATMCPRPGPVSVESATAIRQLIVAAHRMLAGHPRPARIQRRRSAGWRMPEGAVYVGRPTRWGNPFLIGSHGAEVVVAEHRHWLGEAAQGSLRRAIVEELCGKDLACWCPLDRACHADTLLEVANAAAG